MYPCFPSRFKDLGNGAFRQEATSNTVPIPPNMEPDEPR